MLLEVLVQTVLLRLVLILVLVDHQEIRMVLVEMVGPE
jgi:hypothetical protein